MRFQTRKPAAGEPKTNERKKIEMILRRKPGKLRKISRSARNDRYTRCHLERRDRSFPHPYPDGTDERNNLRASFERFERFERLEQPSEPQRTAALSRIGAA